MLNKPTSKAGREFAFGDVLIIGRMAGIVTGAQRLSAQARTLTCATAQGVTFHTGLVDDRRYRTADQLPSLGSGAAASTASRPPWYPACSCGAQMSDGGRGPMWSPVRDRMVHYWRCSTCGRAKRYDPFTREEIA